MRRAALLLSILLSLGTASAAQQGPTLVEISAATPNAPRVGPETGFPIPRYVSLDAPEARARRGPSVSHRIDWLFVRRNMPLIVVAEHGHWRRVIDWEGRGGWMHYSLLSGVRTAIVTHDLVEMRQRPDMAARVRAQAERGVIGQLEECHAGWCMLVAGGYRGWVPQDALWGTDPGEEFD
ncbi:hypothetical protein HKCCE3408_01765 [Rhodobacterales bacterium HKCCE3408]|nr:hypothetical protein [Rhodobacterales bacterium HKCCE3408]